MRRAARAPLPRRGPTARRVHPAQIRERKPLLARLETLDCGKPIDEAEWDMVSYSGCCWRIANPRVLCARSFSAR